jgi:hypothetical protein
LEKRGHYYLGATRPELPFARLSTARVAALFFGILPGSPGEAFGKTYISLHSHFDLQDKFCARAGDTIARVKSNCNCAAPPGLLCISCAADMVVPVHERALGVSAPRPNVKFEERR